MPIVIFGSDEYPVNAVGPSTDIEFFVAEVTSGLSTDVEYFIEEVTSGVNLDCALAADSVSFALSDVELDFSDLYSTSVDLWNPYQDPTGVTKLVITGGYMDNTQMYATDIDFGGETITPALLTGIPGYLTNDRMDGQCSTREARIAHTPDGKAVYMNPVSGDIKIIDPLGRTIYRYNLGSTLAVSTVDVAADDTYLYLLIFVGTNQEAGFMIGEGNFFNDRFTIYQFILTTGEQVEWDWEADGPRLDVAFPEETYSTSSYSYVNYGAPFVESDTALTDSTFMHTSIDFQGIPNVLESDFEFANDEFLDTDPNFDERNALNSDVEYFIEEGDSYAWADTDLVTWEYVQTYAFVDAEPEFIVNNAIEIELGNDLINSESYVLTGMHIASPQYFPSSYTIQPSETYEDSFVCGSNYWATYGWLYMQNPDTEFVIPITDEGYEYAKNHPIGIRRGLGDFWERYCVQYGDDISGQGGPTKYFKGAPGGYSLYGQKSYSPEFPYLRLIATEDKLCLVCSRIPATEHALDEEDISEGTFGFGIKDKYIYRYNLSESDMGKRDSWTHICELDKDTKWAKPDGINRTISNMGCGQGFDANASGFVLLDWYIDSDVDVDRFERYNLDIVMYDWNMNLVFNKDAILSSQSEFAVRTNPWRSVSSRNTIKITDMGVLIVGGCLYSSYSSQKNLLPSHLFFAPNDYQNPVIFKGIDSNAIINAQVIVSPYYIETHPNMWGIGFSEVSAEYDLHAIGSDYICSDLDFATGFGIEVDSFLEDSNFAVAIDVLLGHPGYREEFVIISNSGVNDNKYAQYGYNTIHDLDAGIISKHNIRTATISAGCYPNYVSIWKFDRFLDNYTDDWISGWAVEQDYSYNYTWPTSIGYGNSELESNAPPMPVQYVSDHDSGLMFGIYNKYDDQEINKFALGEYYQDTPIGALFKITKPNTPYARYIELPGRLKVSSTESQFYTFRKMGIDKTNKKLMVIRANGKLDFIGFSNLIFDWRSEYEGGLFYWILKATDYDIFTEARGNPDAFAELAGVNIPLTEFVDSIAYEKNAYLDRDILIYDYDLEYQTVIRTIRGLQEDDVVIHLYEKDSVYYILTQVVTPTQVDLSAYVLSKFENHPDIDEDKLDILEKDFHDFQYHKTRIYKLSGRLTVETAELFYEFNHAGSALDNTVIQEVTDTHIWLNWDGINRISEIPFLGVGINLFTKEIIYVPYLQMVYKDSNTQKWLLATRIPKHIKRMTQRWEDVQVGDDYGDVNVNYYPGPGLVEQTVLGDLYPPIQGGYRVCSPENVLRLPFVGIPGDYNSYYMYNYPEYLPFSDETKYPYVWRDRLLIYRESDLHFIKEQYVGQTMYVTAGTVADSLRYYGGAYPGASTVFRKRIYDWVAVDCKLRSTVTLEPPQTWVDVTDGGSNLVKL